MPLSIGKVTVDVSLCGSIPRSHFTSLPGEDDKRGARSLRSKLAELTSSDLNSPRFSLKQGSVLAETVSTNAVESTKDSTVNGYKTALNVLSDSPRARKPNSSGSQILERADCETKEKKTETNMTLCLTRVQQRPLMRLAPSPPLIDPPRWAVPARGEARLEVSCRIGYFGNIYYPLYPLLIS